MNPDTRPSPEAGANMMIEVTLRWHDGDPAFVATPTDEGLRLTVDPRLSDAQVAHACDRLGEWAAPAHAAWRSAVGLRPAQPPAT